MSLLTGDPVIEDAAITEMVVRVHSHIALLNGRSPILNKAENKPHDFRGFRSMSERTLHASSQRGDAIACFDMTLAIGLWPDDQACRSSSQAATAPRPMASRTEPTRRHTANFFRAAKSSSRPRPGFSYKTRPASVQRHSQRPERLAHLSQLMFDRSTGTGVGRQYAKA